MATKRLEQEKTLTVKQRRIMDFCICLYNIFWVLKTTTAFRYLFRYVSITKVIKIQFTCAILRKRYSCRAAKAYRYPWELPGIWLECPSLFYLTSGNDSHDDERCFICYTSSVVSNFSSFRRCSPYNKINSLLPFFTFWHPHVAFGGLLFCCFWAHNRKSPRKNSESIVYSPGNCWIYLIYKLGLSFHNRNILSIFFICTNQVTD